MTVLSLPLTISKLFFEPTTVSQSEFTKIKSPVYTWYLASPVDCPFRLKSPLDTKTSPMLNNVGDVLLAADALEHIVSVLVTAPRYVSASDSSRICLLASFMRFSTARVDGALLAEGTSDHPLGAVYESNTVDEAVITPLASLIALIYAPAVPACALLSTFMALLTASADGAMLPVEPPVVDGTDARKAVDEAVMNPLSCLTSLMYEPEVPNGPAFISLI